MPYGGTVEIRAENITIGQESALTMKEGKYVKLTFTDQGTGIPKEYSQKIFDPYFTTKEKGSGLGLSASYSIIRNHEGHITVVSEEGVGTTFTIYLPASEHQVSKEEAVKDEALSGTGKVLIMDDEEMVRHVSGTMLKKLGYAVEFAGDGAEAIALYKTAKESGEPFDVIIMDLTIPGGIGGKQAIKQLLEIDPGVRAIVSSGYADDAIMADYNRYGFAGVLIKPYKMDRLSVEVRKVITSEL
jgi:CheY-like chemotaxis protein